jgi:hypothetical protein
MSRIQPVPIAHTTGKQSDSVNQHGAHLVSPLAYVVNLSDKVLRGIWKACSTGWCPLTGQPLIFSAAQHILLAASFRQPVRRPRPPACTPKCHPDC